MIYWRFFGPGSGLVDNYCQLATKNAENSEFLKFQSGLEQTPIVELLLIIRLLNGTFHKPHSSSQPLKGGWI
jgi:hypothetical protein